MMNSMAPTSPLQNQDPIYYTSNNYTPPLTNLNKKPYIDENTLQTIPDDKKEELYKKYETFDSQSERIEINNSHNYNNKPSFQSNIPKKNEMNIINDNNNESNNHIDVYEKDDKNDIGNYISEDNRLDTFTNNQNIVNEYANYENEGDVGLDSNNNNNNNNEHLYIDESNQQNIQNLNEQQYNEYQHNDDHNDYIENITSNPSMLRNKIKKFNFNNKIPETTNKDNKPYIPSKNKFSYNLPNDKNISPIINQYLKSEKQAQSDITVMTSKEKELQYEISQLKSKISSLQSKNDLLSRELQAEKAKNDLLHHKVQEQSEMNKEIESTILKQLTQYLNVQQPEDILPKINELITKNNNNNDMRCNKAHQYKMKQFDNNVHSGSLNDVKIKDELIMKLKTLYIALTGNDESNNDNIDIKTIWRWIKHLINTVKDFAHEKEKNLQVIQELQDAAVFKEYCLEIMQEFNLDTLDDFKQFVNSTLQREDTQLNGNYNDNNRMNNNNNIHEYNFQYQQQQYHGDYENYEDNDNIENDNINAHNDNNNIYH